MSANAAVRPRSRRDASEGSVTSTKKKHASDSEGRPVIRRRPPHVLAADLRAQRDLVIAQHEIRLSKLDARIAQLEDRSNGLIEIAHMIEAGETPVSIKEQIEKQMTEARLLAKRLRKYQRSNG